MLKRLLFFLMVSILLLFVPVMADDLRQSQQQLEQIRARIDKAETALKAQRQSENDISRDLALLRGQLQQMDRRIENIQQEQQRLRADIQRQQQLLSQSQEQVKGVGQRLERRLVALYKEGDSGLLKILFSTESPTEMIQQYHYLTRVMENDADLITEFRTAIAQQQQHLQELNIMQTRQSQLLQQEQQQRTDVTTARNLQTRLLGQAQSENKRLQQELTRLREDATRLMALIEQLKRTPPPPPPIVAQAGDIIDISKHRGQLPWPVNGSVVIPFGTQKDKTLGTLYESNGVEIAARPRSEIRAVARGQVVYADYFRGYGNLVIVSHQGEYHTLYAQLDRLHKKTGDLIATGELLGVSGLSGRESMYFEIRHKGAPVNPLIWLKR